MITSVWSAWKVAACTSGEDEFEATGNAVSVSLVLQGRVDVEWKSNGNRSSASLSSGMAEYRPADGREHAYRNLWQRGSSAFCVCIPAAQFERVTADEGMVPPSRHRHLLGFSDPVIERCMRGLATLDAGSAGIADSTGYGRLLLCRIIELQGLSSTAPDGAASPLSDGSLALIRDYVDTRLSGPVDHRGMAEVAGLSPGHFARRLRSTLGVSPGHYVLARRVRAALWQITVGAAPLAHIARATGFSSQSHMTHALARATGLTPGCARRRQLRVPAWFAIRHP